MLTTVTCFSFASFYKNQLKNPLFHNFQILQFTFRLVEPIKMFGL